MLQAKNYTGQVTLATVTLILKDNKLYALNTAINITLHYTAMRYVPSQIVFASNFPKKLK